MLEIDPAHPQPHRVAQAVSVLKKAGVVVYPTDTVYGLGCDPSSKAALERIYAIKGRPKHHPLTFVCADVSQASSYAHISTPWFRLINRLVPGPYTFVLPATARVPKMMLTRRHTVGIRIPDSPVAVALVRGLGSPIVSTSCVADGDEAAGQPWRLQEALGSRVDLVVDGGELGLEPSTVVDLTGEDLEVIREGKGDVAILE